MKTWHVILVIILCVACFFGGRYSKKTSNTSHVDTIIDTITVPVIEPDFVFEIEEVEVPVPIILPNETDTVFLTNGDTLYIPVPIQQKVYETEYYRAVISGYRANLDTMTIYHKKEIIYQNQRRWGIGIIAGYGVGKNGLSPYVGVGGFYRIW